MVCSLEGQLYRGRLGQLFEARKTLTVDKLDFRAGLKLQISRIDRDDGARDQERTSVEEGPRYWDYHNITSKSSSSGIS